MKAECGGVKSAEIDVADDFRVNPLHEFVLGIEVHFQECTLALMLEIGFINALAIERERDGRDAALICFEVKIDGDAVDMVYGADEIFYLTLVAVYELQ